MIKELAGHPEWVKLLKEAEKIRPIVPQWQSEPDNTNQWKEASAMQRGFDLAMTVFNQKG